MANVGGFEVARQRVAGWRPLGEDAVRRLVEESVREQVTELVAQQVAELVEPLRQELVRQRVGQADRSYSVDLLLGAGHRVNRTVSRRRMENLTAEITALTGVTDLDWRLRSAYRRLVDAESRGLGRIAGSSYNVMAKLVTPTLLGAPDGPVLEIGSLFGIFSACLFHQLRDAGQFRHLTVLDPFAGIQVQPGSRGRGDETGTPVSAEVAAANFALLGVPSDQLRMITGFSTDETIKAEAADRRYAIVVVDGDHSEEGVLTDLHWVQDLLLPGGIAIMDDYGDRHWKGVERALTRYLDGDGTLQLLGVAATSAFLRRPFD